jgi:hypothetical protein
LPQITNYPALDTPGPDDVLVIVDVSDTSQSPTGTTKQITVANLGSGSGGGGGSGVYAPLAGADFTGFVAPAVVTLTYGTSVAVNAAAGNDFRLTLTGSTATIANPTSPEDGQTIKFWIAQDATGSRTLSWASQFNFGGASAPTLSTTASAVDLVGFTYNAAEALWRFIGGTVGGGGSGLGVTLSGTPSAGQAAVATGSTAAAWSGLWGTRPEWFGTITGVSGDQAAVSAAATAINSGLVPGPLVLSQRYAFDSTVTIPVGVDIDCTGQGNRQNFPDTFLGGSVCPSSTFPTGSPTPLLQIGTASAPTTNPNGMKIRGLAMNGLAGGTGSAAANCIGVQITDTSDVYLERCFFGNFDRGGATGTCVNLTSASAGNGVGFETNGCIFSASWRGVYGDGAGITDIRIRGGLFHACTENLTLGATAGGGGLQMTAGTHFTYTGSPSSGWHLSLGSQAGDYTIVGNYFDQDGSAVPVQLANDKGVFNSNHFLATSTSTAVSLVKVTVGSPAELSFQGNEANLNSSSVTALLQSSAHAGVPNGGRWDGNVTFGAGGSFISTLIDSASAPIPQITQPPGGTSLFLRADGTWQNPGVTGGTVSGSYLTAPTSYQPGTLTALAVSSTTLAAFSSANVNTGSWAAPSSGSVVVTATFLLSMATANVNFSFGLAAHGGVTPVCNAITSKISSAAIQLPYSASFVVTGLTPTSSYNFDLLGAIASGSMSIQALGTTSATPTGSAGAPVVMTVQAI